MMASGGPIAVSFRLFAVAELVARKSEISKPTQEKSSGQAENPVFFYVINHDSHRL